MEINGKKLPEAAIGTWAWGAGINGSRMIFGESADKEKLQEAFNIAYSEGFILWDTAAVYGMGEAEKLLASVSEGKEIILSTKFTPGTSCKPQNVEKMLEESVRRFNGRVPDIYWLHTPSHYEEYLEYMCRLYEKGKIGSIGVSNFSLDQIKKAQAILGKHSLKLAGVQNHMSLIYRYSDNTGILDWCRENEVPLFAYMVLEQGALTGKFTKDHPFKLFSRRGLAFPKSRLKKLEPLLKCMEETGNKYGLSIAGTANAWAISKGAVPIIGITKPYQAEDLKLLKNVRLTSDEIANLEKTADETGVSVKASWE